MYADKNSLSENLGLVFKEKQTLINLRKQTPILGKKKKVSFRLMKKPWGLKVRKGV